MKRPVIIAAATLLAASAAEARVPGPVPRHVVPPDCAITIAFGSYAAGIDGATLTRMERVLQQDRRVRRFTRHPWGREGEATLCVYTRNYQGAGPLSRQLRAMIPARPRGPITVTLLPNRVF
jgi:hypothetical protein